MGIAFFTFGGLPPQLQSMLGWFSPPSAPARVVPSVPSANASRNCVRRPLRVVRVLESCQPHAGAATGAGRMVISGRMADVCAELDRLAALEAASH